MGPVQCLYLNRTEKNANIHLYPERVSNPKVSNGSRNAGLHIEVYLDLSN
jgi:hypothetical protein